MSEFPSVTICAGVEEQTEEDGALLSFRTPALQHCTLRGTSKKALYAMCVGGRFISRRLLEVPV